MPGIRYLTSQTQNASWTLGQVAGGAQFDHAFSIDPQGEGCPIACDAGVAGTLCTALDGACFTITPEQALYDVLQVYFNGTLATAFGGTAGTAPLNYLQIYYQDIQYASAHACDAAVLITDPQSGTTFSATAQDLLQMANQSVLEIGEPSSCVQPYEFCTTCSHPLDTCPMNTMADPCASNEVSVEGTCLSLTGGLCGP